MQMPPILGVDYRFADAYHEHIACVHFNREKKIMVKPIYLDYNGTTPHDPEVIEAIRPFLEGAFGNPSSAHWYGIQPKKAVETARRQVAGMLNCSAGEIIFTSGGTESNNHAIRGMARWLQDKGNHIITSSFEHPAVFEVCGYLARNGFEITYLPVGEEGLVDPADVAKAIRPSTILISIMHANNEVGTVQPLKAISHIARKQGIALHTDAAQSVGKIPADVRQLGVDLLSIAGQKVYAPKGVGALYVRSLLEPENFCHGAGQETGRRAGTENIMGIVGLGKACELAQRDLEKNMAHMKFLRDRLHQGLQRSGGQPHPGRNRPRGGGFRRRGLPCRHGGAVSRSDSHGPSGSVGQRHNPFQCRQDDNRCGNRQGHPCGGRCGSPAKTGLMKKRFTCYDLRKHPSGISPWL